MTRLETLRRKLAQTSDLPKAFKAPKPKSENELVEQDNPMAKNLTPDTIKVGQVETYPQYDDDGNLISGEPFDLGGGLSPWAMGGIGAAGLLGLGGLRRLGSTNAIWKRFAGTGFGRSPLGKFFLPQGGLAAQNFKLNLALNNPTATTKQLAGIMANSGPLHGGTDALMGAAAQSQNTIKSLTGAGAAQGGMMAGLMKNPMMMLMAGMMLPQLLQGITGGNRQQQPVMMQPPMMAMSPGMMYGGRYPGRY